MNKLIRSSGEMLQNSIEPILTKDEKLKIFWRLGSVLLAGSLLITAQIYRWLFVDQEDIYALILLIGALTVSLPIFKTALQGFFSKEPKFLLEQLLGLALLAALVNGDYIVAILVPILMSLAHFLEERSILGARAAIDGLKTLQAKSACLLTAEGEKIVPSENLKPGDNIRVRPGDMFPVDGVVTKGRSAVDQSSMTGETIPQDVAIGDTVLAGTINVQGLVEVKVEKGVQNTSLYQIVELLKEAESSKTATMRFIERYTVYYLPLVLIIAALTLFITQDLSRVIAILVVSCPCAQVLVSSSAMISSLAVSSKNGILIKNSAFLESLGSIKTVVFDKTGTLTKGELSVAQIVPTDNLDQEEILRKALIAAKGSKHPITRAICRLVSNEELALIEEADIEEKAGLGVIASFQGEKLYLGKRDWMASLGLSLPPDVEDPVSTVWLAKNNQLLGYFKLSDAIRGSARKAINQLRMLGIKRMILLTGDRKPVGQHIKDELELDAVFAERLPQEKLDLVNLERNNGQIPTMVVGDGVNDALALAQADVGIAMGAMGSDIAVKSADIALMGNDLEKLSFLLKLASMTKRVIYENMGIAALSSVIMIAFAAAGFIPPLLGALLHNVGALLVLLNSARILNFQESNEEVAVEALS